MPGETAGKPSEDRSTLAAQEIAERLAGAIEIHDPEVDRHLTQMASSAALLGAELGLDSGQAMLLRAAAPMHDVGMISTPDGVLRKHGPLTSSERKQMQSHTIVGHQILANSASELLRVAARIALTHHEWFDGRGYPHGLTAEEIPIEGRIAAVADVFDVLLSERPYRPAFETEQATRLIVEESGTHFDPAVVDVLMENVDRALALRDEAGQ